MKTFTLILLTTVLFPFACFAQAAWEFQIPSNSTFSVDRFCITADSCKNITGIPALFQNKTREFSLFQTVFIIKTEGAEYIISNLKEIGGGCKTKKETVVIHKLFTGLYQGNKVSVYTHETWFLLGKEGIKSDIPLQMSIRVKCGDKWLNAAIHNKEYNRIRTRIYY